MKQILFLVAWSACTLAAGGVCGQGGPPAKGKPLDASYLRNHAETRGFMLGRPVKPQPTPDGKAVLFLRSEARKPTQSLYEFDVATGQTRQLMSVDKLLKGSEEKLSPQEKAERERMRVSVVGFANFQLSNDGHLVLLGLSGRLYTVHRGTGAVTELKSGKGPLLDPKFSPDDKHVSYVRENDVHVLELATQAERRVTSEGTDLVPHGLAEFIAQEEMNRFTGYWWSPDSKWIAYQETDNKGVEIWHVGDPANPDQAPQRSHYPRPGKTNAKVRLGVVPVSGGQTTWIEWDRDRYPYMAAVKWTKNGPLSLTVQNRAQTEMVLLAADPATGKTTTLVTETDKAWVNINQDVPRWLPDGQGFLWISERGGGPQLEWRDRAGGIKRVLTPLSPVLQGLIDVDFKTGHAIISAAANARELQLFRVSFKENSAPEPLTKEPGLHTAVFARNHGIYAHTLRPQSGMPKTTIRQADGKLIGELPSVAEDPGFQPNVAYFTIDDNQALRCKSCNAAVIRPRQFDKKKSYPVIVDVYGGPQHIHVVAAMNRWLLDQWLADQGFIVVAIDGRGTPGKSRDWERAIKHQFHSIPLDDQVDALRYVGRTKVPEMDLDRVGISGWSFGGYMSALAVLREPELFKAGVAGAPVIDWLDYDTHYTERYLGVPAQPDDAVYKNGSLLTYAKDLKRPLLLIHGTADDNVYFRHSLRMADTLFKEGKDFEMLPLPSLTHMVPDPLVTERLHTRIASFFKKHLGRPYGKV
jgi:dipeptidyl-peptidase-4